MIVKDAEKDLDRALSSVSWAGEIVVADSGSSDKTLEIARRYTKNVFERPFTDYADQKNFAMDKAKGEWFLSLDADEEVTSELKSEILSVMKNGKKTAYRIRRKSLIFGRWFKYTGTQDDKPIRLWKAGKAKFVQPIHEKVEVDGSIGTLKGAMKHYTYPTSKDYMTRFNDYTSREAELLSKSGAKSGFFQLSVKPVILFFRLYIWRLGFLDGEEGFIFSWLSSTYAFVKHAKRREREKTCV
jgi:glycosyltransferase involved in cell wall biosynthesis